MFRKTDARGSASRSESGRQLPVRVPRKYEGGGCPFGWAAACLPLCKTNRMLYYMETINLYRAVDEMRRISREEGTFSIKFRKYNRQSGRGGDLVRIGQARLRAKPTDLQVKHADHKVFLVDTETGALLVCWQVLIVEFNGRKTVI